MASSSDDDEEERKKFAEIAGIVEKEQGRNQNNDCSKTSASKPSLRNWREHEEESEISNTLITPEFRKHIAKKLSSHLEGCVEDYQNAPGTRKTSEPDSGILLFCSSKERIVDTEQCDATSRQRIPRKRPQTSYSSSSDDDEERSRFSEAAVSGYSILANGSSHGDANKDQSNKTKTEQDEDRDSDSAVDCSPHKRKKKKSKDVTDDTIKRTKKHKKDKNKNTEKEDIKESEDIPQITKKKKHKKRKESD